MTWLSFAPDERALWLQWVLANTVAWAVVGGAAGAVRESVGWEATLVILWTGVGLAAGTGQALVLRRCLDGWGWWIWTSTIGWSFGLPLAALVERPGAWPTLGAFTGALQWWVLRSESPRAWVWFLVALASWSVGMGGGEQVVQALEGTVAWMAIWPPIWAAVSVFTGAAMVWILRSRFPP